MDIPYYEHRWLTQSVPIYMYPHPLRLYRKKEQERQQAADVRKQASVKYTRGISEALVKVMKERGTWRFGSIDWVLWFDCVYVCYMWGSVRAFHISTHKPTNPNIPTPPPQPTGASSSPSSPTRRSRARRRASTWLRPRWSA